MAPMRDYNPSMDSNIEFRFINPEDVQDNNLNWKTHPAEQTRAIESVIYSEEGVGWAGAVLVNNRKVQDGWAQAEAVMTLIDGHERRAVAMKQGGQMPALIGSWSPEKERLILASSDPIGQMAVANANRLSQILEGIKSDDDGIGKVLGMLSEKYDLDNLVKETISAARPEELEAPPPKVERQEPFMQQLFYEDEEIFNQFLRMVEQLGPRFALTTTSEIVFEALDYATRNLIGENNG